MSGLLDFALGFGQGAASGVAQTAQMNIANKAEETRMANLARLRAQYQRENMDYEYGLRAEQARLEAELDGDAPINLDPKSPFGKIAFDEGLPPGSPEYVRRVQELVRQDQVDSQRRTTGNRVTLVNRKGEVRNLDAGADLAAYQDAGWAELNDNNVYEGPNGREYITVDGVELMKGRQGWRPTGGGESSAEDGESGSGRFSGAGSSVERPAIESDPAAAIGPVNRFRLFLSSAPGVGALFQNETTEQGADALMRFRTLNRSIVRAYRYNDSRTTNMDITQAEALDPTKGSIFKNESRVMNDMETLRQEMMADLRYNQSIIEEWNTTGNVSPEMVEGARRFVNDIGQAVEQLEVLQDASIMSVYKFRGKPLFEITPEDLRGIDPRNLNGNERRAIRAWQRYQRGR